MTAREDDLAAEAFDRAVTAEYEELRALADEMLDAEARNPTAKMACIRLLRALVVGLSRQPGAYARWQRRMESAGAAR